MRTRGVLALAAPRRSLFSNPESRRQIEAYATLIAIALERLHYVEVAQQALVSMESEKLRNSLLAAVSHDLRTPLTSLVGMTDTLARQQPVLPADVQDTIRAMCDQAQRMHALVANLLDMARLQSGDTPLRLEWQSVEELVGAALAAMREPLAAHQVTVSSLSQLPLVECDGVLIERVLCNLLENAAKYTPAGSAISWARPCRTRNCASRSATMAPAWPLAPNAGSSRNSLAANANPPRRAWAWAWRCAKPSSPPTMAASVEHAPGRPSGAQFVFTLPLGEPPAIQPETP